MNMKSILKSANPEAIESLAKEIRDISQVVRFDSLILLTYAAEAVNRYLGHWLRCVPLLSLTPIFCVLNSCASFCWRTIISPIPLNISWHAGKAKVTTTQSMMAEMTEPGCFIAQTSRIGHLLQTFCPQDAY